MKEQAPFFHNAEAHLFEFARKMRKNPTPAEASLWMELRRKQRLGFYFRRQHPIYKYIVDFYCHKAKLIIEVEGSIHLLPEQRASDKERFEDLENLELHILCFTNEEVLNQRAKVIANIDEYLQHHLP